jgi:hypothetical protein
LLEKGKVIKDLNEKALMSEELNTYFGV